MKRSLSVLFALVLILLSACGGTANVPDETVAQENMTSIPGKQYLTVDGKEKELVGSAKLTAGYTKDTLVQFTDFYDFGLWDERPLGFSGKIYLNGSELDSSQYRFDGYEDNTTIVLKLYRGKQLTGNTLTVEADSVVYYDDEAVIVSETFSAVWDGEEWTAAEKQ